MVGSDVDADMETVLQQPGIGCQVLRGVHHQRTGHGDDLPTVFGIGDEQVRAYQAFARVVPAHQHFGAGPAVIALAHHRLEIRQELVGFQCPLQLGARRGGATNLPAAHQGGHHAQYQQQAKQGGVMAAPKQPLLVGAIAALHAERVAGRAQQYICAGRRRWHALLHDAILAHPGITHADLQDFIGADQAQRGQQVFAIHRTDRAAVAVAGPIHQQRVAWGDRVAVHQPQLAVDVVARVDRLLECTKQRGAIKGVVPEQVGRAHEGVARDLGTQHELGLVARAVDKWQQGIGSAGQVVENALDVLHHLAGGGLAAGLHFALDLPVHHGQAARHRQHADDPGQQGAPAEAGAAFDGKGHADLICRMDYERIAACRNP